MFVFFFPRLQVLLEPPRGGAHRRSREVSEILWKAIGKPWESHGKSHGGSQV